MPKENRATLQGIFKEISRVQAENDSLCRENERLKYELQNGPRRRFEVLTAKENISKYDWELYKDNEDFRFSITRRLLLKLIEDAADKGYVQSSYGPNIERGYDGVVYKCDIQVVV